MRVKVAFFQQNPIWGACEEYFSLLLQGLDRTRTEPILFCPDNSAMQPLIRAMQPHEKVVHFSDEGPKTILTLRHKIKTLTPDIIHFNDPCLQGMLAARLLGHRKLVMTYHTPELNMSFNWKGRMSWSLAFRGPLHLIALSQRNKETLIERYGFQSNRISVIMHGLNPKKFNNIRDKQEVLNEFKIPREAQVFITVGRLSAQKGYDVLLNALSKLNQSTLAHLKVLVVGDGEEREKIRQQIVEQGLQEIVIMTGHRTDIPSLLAASDVFVLPSHFEGLPYAILEAMAMGKPVIATEVGGVPDLIRHQESGLLIPPGNHTALAQAMQQLFDNKNLGLQMGRLGLNRFSQEFTQDKMIAKTQALYV